MRVKTGIHGLLVTTFTFYHGGRGFDSLPGQAFFSIFFFTKMRQTVKKNVIMRGCAYCQSKVINIQL